MAKDLDCDNRPTIVIIGGGVSGTLTAVNLLRMKGRAKKICLIEPRATVGFGLAYSTPCDEHLLNVRASGMSAFPDQPNHFLEFAQKSDPAIDANTFVSRKFFGHYINTLLNEALTEATNTGSSFEHLSTEAIDIEKMSEEFDTTQPQYKVYLGDGNLLLAHIVVLALGNLSAVKPRWAASLSKNSESYLHNPWDNERFGKIAPEESVLIIGTGLTAIDKLVQLAEAEHKGDIRAISRHGLFPRPHTVTPSAPEAQVANFAKTAKQTFENVKSNSRKAKDWRTVIDGLRADTQRWWGQLDRQEQKRFLRHIQTYWDVHRHRMAPQISAIVEKLKTSGQLTLSAGRIQSFTEENGRVKVTLKLRHQTLDTSLIVDRIINCTGPQSKLETVDSPLLQNLQNRGLVQAHPLGAGIACTADGKVVDRSGHPQTTMMALGPMLKAQLLESVAVPELKVQARATAETISAMVGE